MHLASNFHQLVSCSAQLCILPGLIVLLADCTDAQPGKLPNRIIANGGIMSLPPVNVAVSGNSSIDKRPDASLPPDAATKGQGGNGGMSGSVSEAGMSIEDDPDDGGIECKPLATRLDVSWAPKCPKSVCSGGDSVCLSQPDLVNLAPSVKLDELGKCDDARYCVPVEIASQGGRGVPLKCTSLNKAEGRCQSRCLPKVAAQASILPQDICPVQDLCVPCHDPRTGMDTGACRQGCDPGPTTPPALYPHCCSDRGLCVPPSVSGAPSLDLKPDTCALGDVCAPLELTQASFKPKMCDSVGGSEGRCLSKCVGGALGELQARVVTIGCAKKTEFCAPCFNPLTGEETGACSLHGDMPRRARVLFPHCCGEDLGVCVPPEFVGLQSLALDQAGCELGQLCAPIGAAPDAATKFPVCNAIGGGVCLPSCFINSSVSSLLMQDSCGPMQLCTPCSLIGTGNNLCQK
jgi:hypothetical protein